MLVSFSLPSLFSLVFAAFEISQYSTRHRCFENPCQVATGDRSYREHFSNHPCSYGGPSPWQKAPPDTHLPPGSARCSFFLVWIAPSAAGENPLVSPVFEELGLEPEEMPEEVVARSSTPRSWSAIGLKGIDRDDRVDVIHLGGGKLKIVHPDTGKQH